MSTSTGSGGRAQGTIEMSDDLEKQRKSFEEAQETLRVVVFEALRAPSLNRYKVEEALKRYFETERKYFAKLHDRLRHLAPQKD
jgi:hypothetical protein